MIRAVIFDMDGLIIDTEPFQSKAYEQILREHGKEPVFEENGLVHRVGLRGDEAWKIILEKHSLSGDIEELRKKKREIFLENMKGNLVPMPGLLPLLRVLSEKHIPVALATGSNRPIATYILEQLAIADYFSVLVTGDEVQNGKPDPQCFLLASKRLGILPEKCLVLEDARPGMQAAKSIGMRVIVVPTQYTKDQDFSKADRVVLSLKDVTWAMLSTL